MGGEKLSSILSSSSTVGSPPRGRGKGDKGENATEDDRITPAWAGKRLQFFGLSAARGDHPRVGGEKILLAFLQFWL